MIPADKKLIRPLYLVIFLMLPLWMSGQVTRFEKVYGGPGKDRPYDQLQTDTGNYLVAGGTANLGPSGQAFLYRFDSVADPLWQKGYGGAGAEVFYAVDTSPDSGFIASGTSSSGSQNDYQVYVVRTDGTGDSSWTRKYGGSDWEGANLVKSLPDTTYLVGGYTYSYGNGGRDLFLLRIDKNGDTLWSKTYGTSGKDEFHDLVVDPSGDFIIAGSSRDTGNSDTLRGYLLRTNNGGNELWSKQFSLGYATPFHSVALKGNGDIVATVQYKDSATAVNDVMFISTDASGNLQWQQHYPQPGEDLLFDMVSSAHDTGHLVAGYTTSFGAGKKDIRFFKTSNDGFFKWARTYGGSDEDLCHSVTLTQDSGYFTAAITKSYGNSQANIYLLKTDSVGVSTGNVILRNPEKRSRDEEHEVLLQPNPVLRGEQLHILFRREKGDRARLRVRDLRGRTLKTRVPSEPKKASIRLNTSELRKGIYLITLERKGTSDLTKKLIIR